jgi:4-hydroxybenzoate polyprenyltransferase
MAVVEDLKNLIRWEDWAFDKILPLFLIVSYVSLAYGEFGTRYIHDFICLLILAAASAVYGFLVNDFSDRDLDPQQGKPNVFSRLDRRRVLLILGSVLGLVTLASLRFWQRAWFLPLWILWLLDATFYSLPPLRLKERGAFGLWAPALAQFTLPNLIFFAALGHFGGMDMWAFAIYVGAKGMSIALSQQLADLANDAQTNTATYAVRRGRFCTERLHTITLLTESALMAVLLAVMTMHLPTLVIPRLQWHVNLAMPLWVGYVALGILALLRWRAIGRPTDPYSGKEKDIFNIWYALFPCGGVTLYLVVMMIYLSPGNWPVLLLFILWLNPTPRRLAWPLRALWAQVRQLVGTSEQKIALDELAKME